jgi:hypothetical protein
VQSAAELLGQTVFVEWPYHREALVVAVSDHKVKYTFAENQVHITEWTEQVRIEPLAAFV